MGNVQLTKDEGATWINVASNIKEIPKDIRVSSIVASSYSEGRAYLTLEGHSLNIFNTYVFVTNDFGKSWTKLNNNLPPGESCNVIREGLRNPDLLLLGTETSLWVSLNRGKSWSRYKEWQIGDFDKGYFPTVAIQSMEIHPRELDLIIGTHGRSVYVVPIKSLEELTVDNLAKDVHFVQPNCVYRSNKVNRHIRGLTAESTQDTRPRALFQYYLKKKLQTNAILDVYDADGKKIETLNGSTNAGLNSIYTDDIVWYYYPKGYINAGYYRVVLSVGGKEYTQTLCIKDVTN